jgi:predicted SnoaL-like aldol condensation-catalyzing enzyme
VHYKSVGPRMPRTKGLMPSVIVDVLRFEGTCIVEHWDLAGMKTGNETNPLALF